MSLLQHGRSIRRETVDIERRRKRDNVLDEEFTPPRTQVGVDMKATFNHHVFLTSSQVGPGVKSEVENMAVKVSPVYLCTTITYILEIVVAVRGRKECAGHDFYGALCIRIY